MRTPDLIEEVLTQLIRSLGLHRPLELASGEALSLSELLALSVLAGAEDSPVTQGDLGQQLRLEKSTVSRLVTGLEGRGWVIRQRDDANRRFVQVRLTACGRALAAELDRFMQERHHRMLVELTEAEREALRVGVAALTRAAEATGGPPGEHPVRNPGQAR